MTRPRSRQASLADTLLADRRALIKSLAFAPLAAALPASRPALGQRDPSQGHGLAATPEAGDGGPAPLLDLLRLVPASFVAEGSGDGIRWYYADIAQQFEVLGLSHGLEGPAFDDEDWVPATLGITPASNAYRYALAPEFLEAIGFQPLGANQTLLAGAPPNQLTLFRAGWDVDALVAAWEAAGYQELTTADGTTAWTIGEDGDYELGHPIQMAMFAAFNNVAIVDDEILVYAPTLELLEEALATRAGGDSAADDEVLGVPLATLPATTASAIAVAPMPGLEGVTVEPDQQQALDASIEESDEVIGPMPAIDGMLVGVEAGVAPLEFFNAQGVELAPRAGLGTAMVRLVTGSEADAEQAAAVASWRWNEMNSLYAGEPFTGLMEVTGTAVEGPVAAIDFRLVRSPNVWTSMVYTRDLAPFAPNPEDD